MCVYTKASEELRTTSIYQTRMGCIGMPAATGLGFFRITCCSKEQQSSRAQYRCNAPLYQDMTFASAGTSTVWTIDGKKWESCLPPPDIVKTNVEYNHQGNGRIWIPNEVKNLKQGIVVVVYFEKREYWAHGCFLNAVKDVHSWEVKKPKIREFTSARTLCILLRSCKRVPRPLSITIHDDESYKVSHAGYLYVASAERTELKYDSVIKMVQGFMLSYSSEPTLIVRLQQVPYQNGCPASVSEAGLW